MIIHLDEGTTEEYDEIKYKLYPCKMYIIYNHCSMSPSHKCHSKQNFLHWQLLFILHLLVSFAIHHASSCHISNMRPACQRNWSTQAMMGGESTLTVWWPLTIQVPGTDTALRRRERFNHFEKVKVVVRVIAMECRTMSELEVGEGSSVCTCGAQKVYVRSLRPSVSCDICFSQ